MDKQNRRDRERIYKNQKKVHIPENNAFEIYSADKSGERQRKKKQKRSCTLVQL